MLKRKMAVIILLSLLMLAGCGGEKAQPEVTPDKQPVAATPEVVNVVPDNALFVALYTTNSVAVVDLDKGEVVNMLPVGAKPISLLKSRDNSTIYVANSGTGNIYALDAKTAELKQQIAVGTQPVSMAISDDGKTLYVVDYYLGSVRIVDTTLGSLTGYIDLNTLGYDERFKPLDCCTDPFGGPVEIGRHPAAIVLHEGDNRLYCGNLGTYDVAEVDLTSQKEVSAYDGSLGVNNLLLDESGDKIYLCAAGSEIYIKDSILVLERKGGKLIKEIEVSAKPIGMVLSPDKKYGYVITGSDNSVWKLDLKAGKAILSCAIGEEPGDIAISDDGKTVFTTSLLDGTISVLETETLTVKSTINVGITPKSVVYVKKSGV